MYERMFGVATSTFGSCSFTLRSVQRDVGEGTWQAPLVSEVLTSLWKSHLSSGEIRVSVTCIVRIDTY